MSAPDQINEPTPAELLRLGRGNRSQAEIAQALDMSQPSISRLERGQRLPQLWEIEELAAAYEINPHELREATEREAARRDDLRHTGRDNPRLLWAFKVAATDPSYSARPALDAPLPDPKLMRWIVQLYERASGMPLLGGADADD